MLSIYLELLNCRGKHTCVSCERYHFLRWSSRVLFQVIYLHQLQTVNCCRNANCVFLAREAKRGKERDCDTHTHIRGGAEREDYEWERLSEKKDRDFIWRCVSRTKCTTPGCPQVQRSKHCFARLEDGRAANGKAQQQPESVARDQKVLRAKTLFPYSGEGPRRKRQHTKWVRAQQWIWGRRVFVQQTRVWRKSLGTEFSQQSTWWCV